MDRPAPRWAPPRAVVAGLAVGACLAAAWVLPEDTFNRSFSNVAQLLAAAAATVTTTLRAWLSSGRMRATWAALAAACAAWTGGQLHWARMDMSGQGIPFPSVSDVGFLAFAVLAAVGLVLHPAEGGLTARWQRCCDALMTSAAVGLISWQTTLGAVLAGASGGGPLASALLLAYPVSDVLLIVLALLNLTRVRRARRPLVLVAVGLLSLSVSDSTFAYLQSVSSYEGGLVDLGWVFGFLFLCLAATIGETGEGVAAPQPGRRRAVPSAAYLPYLPVAGALISSLVVTLAGQPLGGAEVATATVIIALLLVRQQLALRENTRLADALAAREAMLRHQAFHDGLTGLANRALFRDRLEHALVLHARTRHPLALVFLDLDDFKVVNDTLGHGAGDELLVRVAERLTGALRGGDTVARLGGDEFAVLVEDDGDPQEIAGRALGALREPFQVGGRSIDVHASVGVCVLGPGDAAVGADELLARSDTAMYAAKRSGKSRVVSYTSGMCLDELAGGGVLREDLRRAVHAGEITLAYQPIVALDTDRVVAVEALARWRSGGVDVGPDVFVPLVERMGLIDRLTLDLLDEACARVVAWSQTAGDDLAVHVNVSPSLLGRHHFVQRVGDLVDRHGLRPGQLVLEVTENDLLEDADSAREVLDELRRRGVGVSLDDFGVGYSSLARLNALPLDSVKIDRSLLDQVDTDDRQARLLAAVVRLADDIGLPVVAEGVERPAQLDALRRLGCPLAQGYLLGRPGPATAVRDVLGGRAPVAH
jgi:diguanylate cyclase (GGDEF)-like protein